MPQDPSVTVLLARWREGDRSALEELMPIVYGELRRVAASYLSGERNDHTLQPTALVHEAFIRLMGQTRVEWQNRAQFIGVAAQMMRRILVDHARAKHAEKRGGGAQMVDFDSIAVSDDEREYQLVALDDALRALATFDERQVKIVEMRFFGGLTIEETAQALDLSPATIKREWTIAKAWLHRELSSRG